MIVCVLFCSVAFLQFSALKKIWRGDLFIDDKLYSPSPTHYRTQ